MIKKQNTVNFADIFYYAEKFDVDWNEANDLFFCSEILRYKRYTNLDLKEEEYAAKDTKYENENSRKAHLILASFMKENKVKELLVLNND